MARQTPSLDALNKKIVALTNRVGFLERALTKAKREPSRLPAIAGQRDAAEREARREALEEYERAQIVEMYRRSPRLAERILENERQRNEFLRSRGLKPEPSHVPEEFREKR